MLTKERVEARAALRPLKQPLFDTGLILAAGVGRVQFFQAPIGGALGAAVKTEADTNLTQSGQIGRPNEHDLYGFKLELQIVGDDGDNTVQDLATIYDTSVYEFFFGQQRPWLQVPAQEIPNGAGIEGAVATNNAAGLVDYYMGHCGIGSCKAMYNFTIGKKPIPIGSAEAFSALLSWPLGAITPAGAANIRATNYLVGIYYSAL
jgi:hypothetical protein